MLKKLSKNRSDISFLLVIILLSILLWVMPTGFEKPHLKKNSLREKAKVLSVNNDELNRVGVVITGTQNLTIQILSGRFKGDTLPAHNILIGQMKNDKIFEPGDKILTILRLNQENDKIISARADNKYRITIELVLFFLFALFLISFAGWTGLKALVSFIFTALAIWKVLVPLFLKGYSPIPVSFLILIITTFVIIYLITGFTKKGTVAMLGSVSGITLTTLLAICFGYFFRIPGTVREFSEALIYSGLTHLRYSDIFLSGIFISATGAVMDVAMDIAASQNEIFEKKPNIKTKELILSGFRISHAVIGTMTTTLLFAYSGSFIFILMAFMIKGTPSATIFNINFIAAEILYTMVGSFGLVLVAPLTAIIGGFLFTKKQ